MRRRQFGLERVQSIATRRRAYQQRQALRLIPAEPLRGERKEDRGDRFRHQKSRPYVPGHPDHDECRIAFADLPADRIGHSEQRASRRLTNNGRNLPSQAPPHGPRACRIHARAEGALRAQRNSLFQYVRERPDTRFRGQHRLPQAKITAFGRSAVSFANGTPLVTPTRERRLHRSTHQANSRAVRRRDPPNSRHVQDRSRAGPDRRGRIPDRSRCGDIRGPRNR